MTLEIWLIYLVPALIAASSPGPAVFLIMARSIEYGWKQTVLMPLGNLTAIFIMSLISVSGLGLILQTSEIGFTIIKILGATYLVYLGYRQLTNDKSSIQLNVKDINKTLSKRKLYWESFVVGISNPKAIIFLGALFPQFIDANYPIMPQFSILFITIMVLSLTFLSTYSILASTIRVKINTKNRIKYFNRVSGALFCSLGIILGISV
jgi:homoserine/homoserine lactone efflux protein